MNILYERKSALSLEDTLDKLKEELSQIGFGILFELNFKDKLKEKGFDYSYDFYVLEVCNPKRALEALSIEQKVGYFLPCKVVVYQSEEGVFIGTTKPSNLMHMISETDNLGEMARSVEVDLIAAINRVN